MNSHEKYPQTTDEFELIELGSVSEETRGDVGLGDEYQIGSINSKAP